MLLIDASPPMAAPMPALAGIHVMLPCTILKKNMIYRPALAGIRIMLLITPFPKYSTNCLH